MLLIQKVTLLRVILSSVCFSRIGPMQPRLLLNSLHLSCVTGQSLATGSYSTCEMCLANITETLPSYLTLKINTLDTLLYKAQG